MSLLSKFVLDHLIPALEEAFLEHEPAMQDLLLREVEEFSSRIGEWVREKLAPVE